VDFLFLIYCSENPEHFLNTLAERKSERIAEANKYEEEIRKATISNSLTKKKVTLNKLRMVV
jgi:hypothetical protein